MDTVQFWRCNRVGGGLAQNRRRRWARYRKLKPLLVVDVVVYAENPAEM